MCPWKSQMIPTRRLHCQNPILLWDIGFKFRYLSKCFLLLRKLILMQFFKIYIQVLRNFSPMYIIGTLGVCVGRGAQSCQFWTGMLGLAYGAATLF